jgi:UDP-N-acetylmuramoyl-L-alanyl-D-glutamate--2,6-diaminopimelate ligase
MGQMAAEHADVIYVTDDNPRTEEPAAIRDMVMEGCKKASNIGDRKRAIQTATAGLKKGDLLLVAGKGHEQGQMIGTVNFEFDDVTEVKNAIKILKDNGKKRKKVT